MRSDSWGTRACREPGAGTWSRGTGHRGPCDPQISSQVSPLCRCFPPAVQRCWHQKIWHVICSSLTFPPLSVVDQREMLLQQPQEEFSPAGQVRDALSCCWPEVFCHSVPGISRAIKITLHCQSCWLKRSGPDVLSCKCFLSFELPMWVPEQWEETPWSDQNSLLRSAARWGATGALCPSRK